MSNQSQGARQKRILITLAICVAAILIATFFGSWIQTAGFRYTVEDLRNKTNSGKISLVAVDDGATEAASYTVSGKVVSGTLFRPKKAEEGSRPAVVLSHGLYNNREMQIQNAIELVRRGYVVIIMDQTNHGHNNTSTNSQFNGQDHLDCAKYLWNLPEVDKTRIGVTGHSMGGQSTRNVITLDGQTPGSQTAANFKAGKNMGIVSAALVQANTPPADVKATNVIAYGVLKGNADEFFYGGCALEEYTYILKNRGQVTEANYADRQTVDGEEMAKYYIKSGKDFVPADSKPFSETRKYYQYSNSGTANNYMQSAPAYKFTRSLDDVSSRDAAT
ncbi:MAG: alpha/beta fold hydrolase, partial [Clostridia bacterium]|nr:alpha/beta fold hydrolase [Clostridia bacterium]